MLEDLLRDGAEQEAANRSESATAHHEEVGGGGPLQELPGRIPDGGVRVDADALTQHRRSANENVMQPRLLLRVRLGREGPEGSRTAKSSEDGPSRDSATPTTSTSTSRSTARAATKSTARREGSDPSTPTTTRRIARGEPWGTRTAQGRWRAAVSETLPSNIRSSPPSPRRPNTARCGLQVSAVLRICSRGSPSTTLTWTAGQRGRRTSAASSHARRPSARSDCFRSSSPGKLIGEGGMATAESTRSTEPGGKGKRANHSTAARASGEPSVASRTRR